MLHLNVTVASAHFKIMISIFVVVAIHTNLNIITCQHNIMLSFFFIIGPKSIIDENGELKRMYKDILNEHPQDILYSSDPFLR